MTGKITVDTIKPKYAKALAALQKKCHPTLGDDEHLREEHFLSHCKLFPEGNFVALCEGQVVGLGSGLLVNFDFDHPDHNFLEMISNGYYTNHDPKGEWYYGGDISVDPDFRRRGIGAKLYAARKGVIKALNLKGLVAGGLIPHFAHHKKQMSARQYVNKVIRGELYDPTLSFQIKQGFKVRGVLKDYLEDEASDNWATLIVWPNPFYRVPSKARS